MVLGQQQEVSPSASAVVVGARSVETHDKMLPREPNTLEHCPAFVKHVGVGLVGHRPTQWPMLALDGGEARNHPLQAACKRRCFIISIIQRTASVVHVRSHLVQFSFFIPFTT